MTSAASGCPAREAPYPHPHPHPYPYPYPHPLFLSSSPSLFPLPVPFPHERLAVYHAALRFLVLANDIVENLPRGRSCSYPRALSPVPLLLAPRAYGAVGSLMRPMNKINPDRTSRIKNRKGWSARNSPGEAFDHELRVPAAASVPSSSTRR